MASSRARSARKNRAPRPSEEKTPPRCLARPRQTHPPLPHPPPFNNTNQTTTTNNTANKQSLEVSWADLANADLCRSVAVWLADAPRPLLTLLDEALRGAVSQRYPEYRAIHEELFVRFTGLPVDDNIRDLR